MLSRGQGLLARLLIIVGFLLLAAAASPDSTNFVSPCAPTLGLPADFVGE